MWQQLAQVAVLIITSLMEIISLCLWLCVLGKGQNNSQSLIYHLDVTFGEFNNFFKKIE